jgi:hypothetical protein
VTSRSFVALSQSRGNSNTTTSMGRLTLKCAAGDIETIVLD